MDKKINSIDWLSQKEIDAMEIANMTVTKRTMTAKDTGVVSHAYSAVVSFDFDEDVQYKLNITNDEYALLNFRRGSKRKVQQFKIPCKVRMIETKWPAKGNGKEHSSYIIQIYVSESLKWEEDFTKTKFMDVYKEGLAQGEFKKFMPLVRIPGEKDKAEQAEKPDVKVPSK